jgi:hypothetical protein
LAINIYVGYFMIIKSIRGQTIIKTNHRTMRAALEYCAQEGIDLSNADLRKARLTHASLDGLKASGACLWGADFTASDIGFADLRDADLRGANFKNACLAESDLTACRLEGAYFSGTILEKAVFNRAIISCPSFWDCDLQSLSAMKGLVYDHLGEVEITLQAPPLIVRGLERRLVLARDYCFWGSALYPCGLIPSHILNTLFSVKTMIERTMCGDVSHFANQTIPKIRSCAAPY